MKIRLVVLMTLVIFVGGWKTADAALIDRGGGMIYSTEMNVTWLQDANYARTTGYDADGLMTWTAANQWATNLVYGGYSDWRLPRFDGANPGQGSGSLLNELEYLRYNELGNHSFGLDNRGPFINLVPGYPEDATGEWYWTGTLADADHAWRHSFTCG